MHLYAESGKLKGMNTHLFAELKQRLAKHAQSDGLPHKVLSSVTVARIESPISSHPHIASPTFSLIVQGAKQIALDKKVIEYGVGQYLITSIDLPINLQIKNATASNPFLGFGLMLKPTVIASLLLEAGATRSAQADTPGIGVSDLTDELIEPVIRLLRLLDHPSDIPVLAQSIEREIIWRLLNGPQGMIVKQLGLPDSKVSQIGSAIRWIRENYAETIRIENLAAIACMSVTSLHRHFRSITSMTPIQYQKQIRLQEARLRLTATGDDVANIGFSVGYESPSQFSREYRRQFGVPPSHHR